MLETRKIEKNFWRRTYQYQSRTTDGTSWFVWPQWISEFFPSYEAVLIDANGYFVFRKSRLIIFHYCYNINILLRTVIICLFICLFEIIWNNLFEITWQYNSSLDWEDPARRLTMVRPANTCRFSTYFFEFHLKNFPFESWRISLDISFQFLFLDFSLYSIFSIFYLKQILWKNNSHLMIVCMDCIIFLNI